MDRKPVNPAHGSLGSLSRKSEGTAGSLASRGGSLGSPGSLEIFNDGTGQALKLTLAPLSDRHNLGIRIQVSQHSGPSVQRRLAFLEIVEAVINPGDTGNHMVQAALANMRRDIQRRQLGTHGAPEIVDRERLQTMRQGMQSGVQGRCSQGLITPPALASLERAETCLNPLHLEVENLIFQGF